MVTALLVGETPPTRVQLEVVEKFAGLSIGVLIGVSVGITLVHIFYAWFGASVLVVV